MVEACYTARANTKQQVIKGIGKLALQTNEHGQYMHDAILLLQKGIRRVLVSQFNPSNPGKGMGKLLEDGTNLLTNIKSTVNQSRVWMQILISNAGYLQKNTRTTMYTMPPCYRIL